MGVFIAQWRYRLLDALLVIESLHKNYFDGFYP
jgi:hypothetical protein